MNTNNAVQLQDKIDGHDIYPITLASLVQTSNGSNIEDGKADKDNVYTKSQVDQLLEDKISGENIKTINHESILGDGNLLLASLDEGTRQSVIYKALKQGEEQMLTLKSMDNLDIMPLDTNLRAYDLNDDGAINYAEIAIIYSISLGIPYDGFYYRTIHQIEDDPTSPLLLQKAEDEGTVTRTWVTVEGKNPDIDDDGSVTSADIDDWYDLIETIANAQGVAFDRDEFTGYDTIFSAYDSKENKIVIGYNFVRYSDPQYNKNNYTLLKLDPSPNVIYCNSFNNKIYRWNAHREKMVELNLSISTELSNLLTRVEQVERQIEDFEGSTDADNPQTPSEPFGN